MDIFALKCGYFCINYGHVCQIVDINKCELIYNH